MVDEIDLHHHPQVLDDRLQSDDLLLRLVVKTVSFCCGRSNCTISSHIFLAVMISFGTSCLATTVPGRRSVSWPPWSRGGQGLHPTLRLTGGEQTWSLWCCSRDGVLLWFLIYIVSKFIFQRITFQYFSLV